MLMVQLVLAEQTEHQVFRANQVPKVLRVLMVQQVLTEQMEHKVFRANKVFKV